MKDVRNVEHWYGISVTSDVMIVRNTTIRNVLIIMLIVGSIDVIVARFVMFVINRWLEIIMKWSNVRIVSNSSIWNVLDSGLLVVLKLAVIYANSVWIVKCAKNC